MRIFRSFTGKRAFLSAVLLLLPPSALSTEIRPFKSDGCSSFPDGTFLNNELWLPCCVAHDYAYWKGGTIRERVAADEALRQCVASLGEPEIAKLMLAGVKVGGTPYLPTSFRWGYGWPFPRGYQALSEEDLKKIENLKEEP